VTVGFLANFYRWELALHLMSVIAWLAALLYLPRLYVYHCQTVPGSTESERFKVMEARLLRGIANPAMMAAWVFGILLVLTPGAISWTAGWWHVKLTCVILMSGYHGALSAWRKRFRDDANRHSERFYRIANEIPAVLMVIIVIMVVVQPF
jgi:protoporphyrinogen IX oxidase